MVEDPAGGARRAHQHERAVLAGEVGADTQQGVQTRGVEEREAAEVEDEGADRAPYRQLDLLGELRPGLDVELAVDRDGAGAADRGGAGAEPLADHVSERRPRAARRRAARRRDDVRARTSRGSGRNPLVPEKVISIV